MKKCDKFLIIVNDLKDTGFEISGKLENYIKSQGKNDLASRYSDYYTKLSQSHNVSSPIADIQIEDSDFDAVLGMVENQIMELPDGKNFYPSEAISLVDYLNCLKLFEN